VSSLRLEQVPAHAVEAGQRRLFDTWASFAAGAATAEAALLREIFGGSFPDGMLFGNRVRYACGATRCTEIDDIHTGSCTTVGSIVVPVALLNAAERGVADGDVLCSIVAGYDAMTRLGCAIDGAHRIYQGIWGTYLAAPLTAAAATARQMGLNAGKTAHAMAIAAARSTGMTTRVAGERSPRWYLAGAAAAEGLAAARAAEAGMEGDPGILESAFGPAAGVQFNAAEFGREPDTWRILDVDVKPFQTSRQGLSATEAFLRLMEGRTAQSIQELDVWTPEQVMPLVHNPSSPLGLRQQLARAAVDRQALWDVAGKRPLDEAAVAAFKGNITLTADAKLTSLYPGQWGGRVRITWSNGASDELEVLDPEGSAAKPYGWDELLRKHRRIGEVFGHEDLSWLERLRDACMSFGREPEGKRSRELVSGFPGNQYLEGV
jgi:2-methylcitrate dehydratase PrpD